MICRAATPKTVAFDENSGHASRTLQRRESEAKWRKAWAEAEIFKTRNDDPRPKYYVLEMFPYPWAASTWATSATMRWATSSPGYRARAALNVLHPMGWDAFGMPAENAAIQNRTHPATWTYANIDAMRAQLQSMGLSLDWSREIATCDPSYYSTSSGCFSFPRGRAGRAQEIEGELGSGRSDGAGERAGDRRAGLAIGGNRRTARTDAMVPEDHRLLRRSAREPRPPRPLAGKSPADAAKLDRAIRRPDDPLHDRPGDAGSARGRSGASELEIYTTRPDTLFGAKFMAIAPDHPLAAAAARHDPALAEFIEDCRRVGTSAAAIETAEKKGYDTGVRVLHPFNANGACPSTSPISS